MSEGMKHTSGALKCETPRLESCGVLVRENGVHQATGAAGRTEKINVG